MLVVGWLLIAMVRTSFCCLVLPFGAASTCGQAEPRPMQGRNRERSPGGFLPGTVRWGARSGRSPLASAVASPTRRKEADSTGWTSKRTMGERQRFPTTARPVCGFSRGPCPSAGSAGAGVRSRGPASRTRHAKGWRSQSPEGMSRQANPQLAGPSPWARGGPELPTTPRHHRPTPLAPSAPTLSSSRRRLTTIANCDWKIRAWCDRYSRYATIGLYS